LRGRQVSGPIARALVQNAENPLRQRTNFACRFNVIWVVQIAWQK
jgi:hypothetical protein